MGAAIPVEHGFHRGLIPYACVAAGITAEHAKRPALLPKDVGGVFSVLVRRTHDGMQLIAAVKPVGGPLNDRITASKS